MLTSATRQRICLSLGVVVLVIALAPPLEPLSHSSFAAHMAQHMLLAVVAPPLVVLGGAHLALLRALPRRARRRLGPLIAASASRRIRRVLTNGPVAFALHTAAIWIWHAPRFYAAALHSDALHGMEHLCLLGTGVLLWASILRREGARRRPDPAGFALLFGTAVQTGALGAILALSHRVLYPQQSDGSTMVVALADQHLGGMLMWVPGGVIYLIYMSVLFVVWLDTPARRRLARAAVAVGSISTIAGCGRAEAHVPGGDPERGRADIAAVGCGACHVIGGIPGADGEVGPPLGSVSQRAIIGGVLPNTPDNMVSWLEDPPAFAPRTAMPNLWLSPAQARDIVAYLYTLK